MMHFSLLSLSCTGSQQASVKTRELLLSSRCGLAIDLHSCCSYGGVRATSYLLSGPWGDMLKGKVFWILLFVRHQITETIDSHCPRSALT
ncbi:hypothetical protein QQP08_017873 [Theobroma cacao]|nr:hypothetical protein QQP08_017873 [Theobroma cacao]